MLEFKYALKASIPVLLGYLAIGIGFGLLMQQASYSWWFVGLMSLLIYAGAAQYLAVGFLSSGAGLGVAGVLQAAGITLLVNARHVVYGLSLLERYQAKGLARFYLIFALTDETYALASSLTIPAKLCPTMVYLWLSGLNQSYWCLGSLIGFFGGTLLPKPLVGVDFALTSLFVVLCVEQFRAKPHKLPFVIAGISSLGALLLLGPQAMLIPSIALSLVALVLFKKRLAPRDTPGEAP